MAKLVFLLAFFGFIPTHDFHTSLAEVNYNPKTQALEITVRVFTDDLERALTEFNNGKSVKISSSSNANDALIHGYLKKHFAFITPDKKLLAYDFLGKEIELDATWLYIELPDAGNLGGHMIYNNIMLELFEDQTNLLNLIYPDKKKSFVFDAKNKAVLYPF